MINKWFKGLKNHGKRALALNSEETNMGQDLFI